MCECDPVRSVNVFVTGVMNYYSHYQPTRAQKQQMVTLVVISLCCLIPTWFVYSFTVHSGELLFPFIALRFQFSLDYLYSEPNLIDYYLDEDATISSLYVFMTRLCKKMNVARSHLYD